MAEKSIIDEYQARLDKLENIKKSGANPFPNQFEKKQTLVEAKNQKQGAKIKTAGRIMSIRVMGKIVFCHLEDSSGQLQIVLNTQELGQKDFDFFTAHFDVGDFLGVAGEIFTTKKGEISVLVKKYQLLAKALLPLPEKWHGLQDKEIRYRQRYLDLIANREVKQVFVQRSQIIEAIRKYLKEEQFIEVETPNLQAIYGGASATPFKTHLNALDIDLYLSISPELYLKRLIVGGLDKVFTISKNFRNEGIDKFHNPEFTMLEFYLAYANYEKLMTMTEELLKKIFKALGLKETITYQGQNLNFKNIPRVRFADLIKEKTGIDISVANDFEKLSRAIKSQKLKDIDISGGSHYGALLDQLYKRVVRPGIVQPVFLTHYPVEMIALAKRNEDNPRLINTFQLIVAGAEMVKAYDELNDPLDQEERLKEQAQLLNRGDSEAMPMDEDFITALKHGMPPTAGYGLGIDRLAMLLTDQPSIRDVILFPFMRPEK
ncbi:MAG TPA: lysine--tRNA ligase [bacterium]|nr:lysine--tRNA ligase [bacterium]HNS34223.1 lysine--tRNA ligase [bacterium]HNZ73517.1 lysine--tRNA ligase [bacterium]HOH67373.1 lysine--tRNA ligase [bacterium]